MINAYIRALEYTIPIDNFNNTVLMPAIGMLDFNSDNNMFLGFKIDFNERKAQNWTVENRLITDISAINQVINVKYQYVDVNFLSEIKRFYDAQCDNNYCLEFHWHNECGGCDLNCCACQNSCSWLPCYLTIPSLDFIDCGKGLSDFNLKIETYSKDCLE